MPIFHGVANFGREVQLFRKFTAPSSSGGELDRPREAEKRVARIQREVLAERRREFKRQYREFECMAILAATEHGEELSPRPTSGAAGQMGEMLKGQALFDEGAARILENLGLTATGRNKPWKGLIYSSDAAAELDTAMPKSWEHGAGEKTASPRIRR